MDEYHHSVLLPSVVPECQQSTVGHEKHVAQRQQGYQHFCHVLYRKDSIDNLVLGAVPTADPSQSLFYMGQSGHKSKATLRLVCLTFTRCNRVSNP